MNLENASDTKMFIRGCVKLLIIFTVTAIFIVQLIPFFNEKPTILKWMNHKNDSVLKETNASHHEFYICTQVWNETYEHIEEWVEHQLFRLGFRNVCLISVGEPLNRTLVAKYNLATITKVSRAQEWNYCMECFLDPPMRPQDLIMIQDIDEYLNVQQADAISSVYDEYDMFHFTDLRYGYVYETDAELKGKSLLKTNVYRRQNEYLGEYVHPNMRDMFECNDACDTTNGKEMIKVGAVEALGTHYHTPNNRSNQKRFYLDMKHARLNHYCMRTRENSLIAGEKWNKNGYKSDLIRLNNYFSVVYDPSVVDSKKLL